MKYAETIMDIPNAFPADPLKGEELDIFYDDETMLVRTGSKGDSPIEDIYDHCTDPSLGKALILLGHKGCGKSTELNRMVERLENEGYAVKNIDCWNELDLSGMAYTDILILLGDALSDIAIKNKCDIPKDILEDIYYFWRASGEESISDESEYEIGVEGGLNSETPSILNLIKVFFNVKANIKQNSTKRKEYKIKIERRLPEWSSMLRRLADCIADKLNGKLPIIIFENLDKLDGFNPEAAWDVFNKHGGIFSSFPFPIVYTFPISLSYDPNFSAVEGYFERLIMPMIKLRTLEGTPYEKGQTTIENIIKKRADLSLFGKGVLNEAIRKTGGCLRDLFTVIRFASTYSRRNGKTKIGMEETKYALEKVKGDITRRIAGKQHDFLVEIYNGMHMKIADKPMLLEMMKANAVLEYNGQRWHDVHPLVADYLVDDLHMTKRREND